MFIRVSQTISKEYMRYVSHYANMPLQYAVIFTATVKIDIGRVL